jgi:hypothetical protein
MTVMRVHFIEPGPAATNKREFPFTGNTASSAKIDCVEHSI